MPPSEPIGVQTITGADLDAALDPEERAAVAAGAFDGGDVWYEFQTREDDKVRPAHAALDGSVWRVGDPNAPVPPLDYGCRCSIRYVARPGSEAAKVLPPAPGVPTTHASLLAKYLADRLRVTQAGVGKVADSLANVSEADRLGVATLRVQTQLAKIKEPSGLTEARPLARMILQIDQPAAPDAGRGGLGGGPTPPPVTPPPVPPPVTPVTPPPVARVVVVPPPVVVPPVVARTPKPKPVAVPPPVVVPPPPPVAVAVPTTLAARAKVAQPIAAKAWERDAPYATWTPEERVANRIVGRAAAAEAIRSIAPLRKRAVAQIADTEAATKEQRAAQDAHTSAYLQESGQRRFANDVGKEVNAAGARYLDAARRSAPDAEALRKEWEYLQRTHTDALARVGRLADATAALEVRTQTAGRAVALAKATQNALDNILRKKISAANPSTVAAAPGWAPLTNQTLGPDEAVGLDRFGGMVSQSSGWRASGVVIDRGGKRGSAERGKDGGAHTVELRATGAGAHTMAHELGHTIEYDRREVFDAAKDFLLRRTRGNPLLQLQKTQVGYGYKEYEVYREGGFISPYVGKDYGAAMTTVLLGKRYGGGIVAARKTPAYKGTDATEVVSMGLEYLADKPSELLARDPEHFRLAVKAAMGAL